MGCGFHLIVNDPRDPAQIPQTVDLLRRLESRWSRFLPDSDTTRINNGAGSPVTVAPETIELIQTMKQAWKLTQGRYDPTVLPALVSFGYATSRVDPASTTILPTGSHRMGAVDEVTVDRHHSTVTVPTDVALDPGGIGKGLAADAAVAFLLEGGAAGALVDIGGDLVAGGIAPDADGWRVDIEHPDQVGTTPLCRATIDQGGVATSSTRSRRWVQDGRTRHHAIDPATGAPSETDLATVTVFSTNGWRAEAFSTAALLAGSESVIAYLDSHDLSGLAVTRSNRVLRTADLDDLEILTMVGAR